MTNPQSHDPQRRLFINAAGTTAAALLAGLPATAMAAPNTPAASSRTVNDTQAGRADDPPAAASGAAPEGANEPDITLQTIAEAEKLAGISFDDDQREMLATSLPGQIERLAKRQSHGLPPNHLAPALTFDPRLPGRPVEVRRGVNRWPVIDPGPLPESDEDIAFSSVGQLSAWIRQRQLTSVRLTQIYLDRLKRYNDLLECVVTLTEDRAMRQAQLADREITAGRWRGPLHGIPWGAKDLLDTAGIRTTWGARPYRDRIPDGDATVVRKLDEAGAVLVAKLTLGAMAYGDIWFDGRTNNPWNPHQGSSGSSAGSASAVVAGLVGFTIGTETYGSIVSPCMRCGATGLRPTFGRVSRAGAMALCWSLDKIGPICRTVEDTAMVLAAINGGDEQDASSIDLPLSFDLHDASVCGLRVGYHRSWFEGRRVSDLDRMVLDLLPELGVEMVEIDLPDWPYDTLLTILFSEAAAAFEELTRTGRDRELRWQAPAAWPNTFRQTWFVPAVELMQVDRFRREVMQMMADRFDGVDAMVAPSFAASLLLITNNTGHPALVLRTGFSNENTPHGITFMGRLFDEPTICRLGFAVQNELKVWDARPPLE